jgi:hypothetical protein
MPREVWVRFPDKEAFLSREKELYEILDAFDGKDETFFDGISRIHFGGSRRDGGCLRVDFGAIFTADAVCLEYFTPHEPTADIFENHPPVNSEYSTDLGNWHVTTALPETILREESAEAVVDGFNNIVAVDGNRMKVTYSIDNAIRYFRMPVPPDRIHKIALIKDGEEIPLSAPHANNLLPLGREVCYTKEATITLTPGDYKDGRYLSVCLEGFHGAEGAYAVLEMDGSYRGAPDRAPSYVANPWEFLAAFSQNCEGFYTYYFPVTADMVGKPITVRILGLDSEHRDYGVRIFLCDPNDDLPGIIVDL